MDAFGFALLGLSYQLVLTALEVGQFALELRVTSEPVGMDATPGHGATGLALMAAVAKAATGGSQDDVMECQFQALPAGPQLQLAHTRVIDQEPSLRREEHFALHSGVPAAVVAGPNILNALAILAQ